MQRWEQVNKNAYRAIATQYHERTKNLDMKWQQAIFLDKIPARGSILDFMSGPSRDAKAFTESGFHVTCTDYEQQFLDIITKEVPTAKTYQGDARTVNLGSSFDGVWCNAGIFMFPREEVPVVLENISRHLKQGGWLYLNFKLQNAHDSLSERVYVDTKYGGVERFESFFTPEAMKQFLATDFDVRREMIAYSQNVSYRTHPFMDLFCVKK